MALSDYLTAKEWDACFYRFILHDRYHEDDLGTSMHKTIDHLLSKGYVFPGLDKYGSKKSQVDNGINANKIMGFLEGISRKHFVQYLTSGREFIREHAPDLILIENDEEWSEMLLEFITENA